METTARPATQPNDDPSLVRRIAMGSESALGALYDRHAAAVFSLALSVGHDHGVAEEVVQETFLALWNRAEVFDPTRGSLRSWLFAIARNRALDHIRWTARRVPAAPFSVAIGDRPDEAGTVEWLASSGVMVGAGAPEPDPEAAFDLGETQASVSAALGVLSDLERETILLAYRDGLSQSEIATRLGWPLGTVKTRSRRALRRLRDALEPTERVCCPGAAPSA
ncbi:MAG TPA: sigma-70 family RNA polymerase sigma factor [Candidatus Limnocylindrales bacterium]|nr:sigma-70 family RNA polymerase sigma factor [Candidatus Limnocylindrales bacterium]